MNAPSGLDEFKGDVQELLDDVAAPICPDCHGHPQVLGCKCKAAPATLMPERDRTTYADILNIAPEENKP